MNVWVVRDSCCGNGDDDSGEVLGVFASLEAANYFAENADPGKYQGNYPNYSIDVEGPFEVKGA